jgi:hypothetical protein
VAAVVLLARSRGHDETVWALGHDARSRTSDSLANRSLHRTRNAACATTAILIVSLLALGTLAIILSVDALRSQPVRRRRRLDLAGSRRAVAASDPVPGGQAALTARESRPAPANPGTGRNGVARFRRQSSVTQRAGFKAS